MTRARPVGGAGAALAIAGAMIVACALAGPGGPARADQSDARLEGLFAALSRAAGAAEAAPAEQQIWSIWTETPDPGAAALMQGGIDAMARRDLTTAIRHFTALVEFAPGFAEAWNKRATAHYLAGNYEASLSDIARTLELEPRHFGALSGRGMVFVQLDDLPRALASFEAALAVHPYLTGALANAEAIRQILGERNI